MPYQLNRYNRTTLTTVQDGVTDQSTTSLTFVGKNFAGYGGIQNENFLYLLENFAGTSAPSNPIAGQIWYDSSTNKIKYYDSSTWRTTGGSYIGATGPTTSVNVGDFWYDTNTQQLNVWNGTGYTLIGPQGVYQQGTTILESKAVQDTLGNNHAVIEASSNGSIVFVISEDDFDVKTTESIHAKFSHLNPGITLANVTSGKSDSKYKFFGTATNADTLGSYSADQYVRKDSAHFITNSVAIDNGLTVGLTNDIKIFVDSGKSTIQNTVAKTLYFKTTDPTDNTTPSRNPLVLDGYRAYPGANDTYDLGIVGNRWKTLYAKTVVAESFVGVSGSANTAVQLLYDYNGAGSNFVNATDANTPNTIVARNSSGNFAANIITATATQARYADLAEKYESDGAYEPGTVVVFGGTKEITITDTEEDTRVAGVISTDPAYLMNIESDGLPVALRGKVPCKVVGPVNKGDVLISSTIPGYARRGNVLSPAASIIGKSLEDKFDRDLGTIMIVVT